MTTLLLKHPPRSTAVKPVELMPGDVAIGHAGDQMKTLLGSCVSVILTDPHRTVGAMCHIVHVGQASAASGQSTAYGAAAMQDMFGRLRAKGINPLMCEAYVYGGGNMFPHIIGPRHVGAINAEWALDYLYEHNIPVVDHSLGGNAYRKVSWTVGPTPPEVETVLTEQGSNHGG